jgi:hypothetical protein
MDDYHPEAGVWIIIRPAKPLSRTNHSWVVAVSAARIMAAFHLAPRHRQSFGENQLTACGNLQ